MKPRRFSSDNFSIDGNLYDRPRFGKRRAGYTTNKRQGQSKTRRKMSAQSRKVNRR